MKANLSGSQDAIIDDFARQVRNYGRPFSRRFAHEMNGNWYPWGGALSGNDPQRFFFFKQKTAYEIGLGIPAEPLFRSSDKLVLTSVTPASSAPVLQTPKATSSTLYFDSLTVNAGNGGFLHCIQMDTSVNAANQVVSVG